MARTIRPAIERLIARIVPDENGCWIFTGATSMGYGVVGLGGRGSGNDYAHRVTYRHFRGPIGDGMQIDHLCMVRRCCNPDHLEAVTQAENVRREMAVRTPKTHCKWGHEFTPENTRCTARQRLCLTCSRLRTARRKGAA